MKATKQELVSVVVPLFNEELNVPPLVCAVREALDSAQLDWELILVDDGSSDRTRRIGEAMAKADTRVRLISLVRNYGQSTAMQAGFDHARGAFLVSMDGDLQNDPKDIPRLLDELDVGYDLVVGYRLRRKDALLTRKFPSWVANYLIRRLTGLPIRDNGCSLKAYRRELVQKLTLYSDMHRFIPALAAATVGVRISQISVRHHARRFGKSKYGLSRTWKVTADLVTIKMISSFRERPLHLFAIGAVAAGVVAALFGIATLTALPGGMRPEMAYAFVFPGVTLMWLSLGISLFMDGLLGEVVVSQLIAEACDLQALEDDA